MKVSVDLLFLVLASFNVIGIIEWMKSLREAAKGAGHDPKALAWVLLSPVLSFLVALTGDGGAFQVAFNAITILSFNEILGYNVIVKTVFALVDRLTGSAPVKASMVSQLNAALDKVQKMAGGGASAVAPPSTGEPTASPSLQGVP